MTSSSMSSNGLIHHPSLSLVLAQRGLDAAILHAKDALRVPVNISIYSPALRLLAFASMDDAKLTSIDIAHNKAFTAAGHRAPTSAYDQKRVGPGGSLYGVQHSNDGRFTTIAGGVPVMVDGQCVGAIGVSGGTPAQDEVGPCTLVHGPTVADESGDRQQGCRSYHRGTETTGEAITHNVAGPIKVTVCRSPSESAETEEAVECGFEQLPSLREVGVCDRCLLYHRRNRSVGSAILCNLTSCIH